LDLIGGARCAVGCAVGGIGSQCGLIGNPILIGVLIVRSNWNVETVGSASE